MHHDRQAFEPRHDPGRAVTLEIGPVAPTCAKAWINWAHGAVGALRSDPAAGASLSPAMLDEVDDYLQRWSSSTAEDTGSFQWRTRIDPDRIEYLVVAFLELDVCLGAEGRGERYRAPVEGRAFYVTLLGALLHALEIESPARAAFVDQLRWSWPSAVEAR